MGRGRAVRPSSKAGAGSAEAAKLRANLRKAGCAQLPSQLRRIRACMICSLIKTEREFEEFGCDNCNDILDVAGVKGCFTSYTSENYEGMIAMIKPTDSWVAKWQCLAHCMPGMYATNVVGEIEEEWIIDALERCGRRYFSRDKSLRFKTPQVDLADMDLPSRPPGDRRRAPLVIDDDDSGNEMEDLNPAADESEDHESEPGDREEAASIIETDVNGGDENAEPEESGHDAGSVAGFDEENLSEVLLETIKQEIENDMDENVVVAGSGATAVVPRGDDDDEYEDARTVLRTPWHDDDSAGEVGTPRSKHPQFGSNTHLPNFPPPSETAGPYRSGRMYLDASNSEDEGDDKDSSSSSDSD